MTMIFFSADNQDHIDPGFNFRSDEYTLNRQVQRDDVYPHEYFDTPPYDGILVSRAIVGDERWRGKYTTAQSMRFKRDGARAFLRYNPRNGSGWLMGDCGAFSYVKEFVPPYTVSEMVEYYAECGFTHGVSIDHVILGYDEKIIYGSTCVPEDWVHRFKITQDNAKEFLTFCHQHDAPFQPIGVAQGWSPDSYREAVRRLVDFGYDYIAIGGMVPLKVPQIHRILEAVREVASMSVRLHLFGFTKADNIAEFVKYNIASLDSTSPLLRAFKDGRRNYLAPARWYTAIRLPNIDTNRKFQQEILAGMKQQRELRKLEEAALFAMRAYSEGVQGVDATMQAVVAYGHQFSETLRESDYRETIEAAPWKQCPCKVCREAGVEVIIFRGSNRNRRRGYHNLWEFYRQLQAIR